MVKGGGIYRIFQVNLYISVPEYGEYKNGKLFWMRKNGKK